MGLTNTEFGLLTGLIFIIFYSVAGLFMGMLADKVNRTRLHCRRLGIVERVNCTVRSGKGFCIGLAIPRLFIGVGESIMTPTSMSLLADRFPRVDWVCLWGLLYGRTGWLAASLIIVAYLEPIWLAWLLLRIRWRGRVASYRDVVHQRNTAQTRGRSGGAGREAVREIVQILLGALKALPALTMTIGGGVAFHFILGAATFEQLWFVEERGFDRTEIAELTGWIALAAVFWVTYLVV